MQRKRQRKRGKDKINRELDSKRYNEKRERLRKKKWKGHGQRMVRERPEKGWLLFVITASVKVGVCLTQFCVHSSSFANQVT